MWLLELIGIIMFALGILFIMLRHEDLKTFLLVVIATIGFVIALTYVEKGEPKTLIETGDYLIVSYAEIASRDELMYQMILEQNGKIKFYALPKNMITIDKSNGKSGTLEVIEKAGFKKAIMHP